MEDRALTEKKLHTQTFPLVLNTFSKTGNKYTILDEKKRISEDFFGQKPLQDCYKLQANHLQFTTTLYL